MKSLFYVVLDCFLVYFNQKLFLFFQIILFCFVFSVIDNVGIWLVPVIAGGASIFVATAVYLFVVPYTRTRAIGKYLAFSKI